MSAVVAQPTVKYVLTCPTIHADHAASGRSEDMYSWSASKWKTESGAPLRVHASAKPVALSHGWNESAHGTGGMRLRQTILAAAATEKLPSASEKLRCPWSGLASRVGWPVLLLSEAPTSAVAMVVRELTRLAFIRVRSGTSSEEPEMVSVHGKPPVALAGCTLITPCWRYTTV